VHKQFDFGRHHLQRRAVSALRVHVFLKEQIPMYADFVAFMKGFGTHFTGGFPRRYPIRILDPFPPSVFPARIADKNEVGTPCFFHFLPVWSGSQVADYHYLVHLSSPPWLLNF